MFSSWPYCIAITHYYIFFKCFHHGLIVLLLPIISIWWYGEEMSAVPLYWLRSDSWRPSRPSWTCACAGSGSYGSHLRWGGACLRYWTPLPAGGCLEAIPGDCPHGAGSDAGHDRSRDEDCLLERLGVDVQKDRSGLPAGRFPVQSPLAMTRRVRARTRSMIWWMVLRQ